MKPKPFSCALLTLVGLAVLREHGLSSAQTEEELVQIRLQEQQRRVQEQQQRVQEQQQQQRQRQQQQQQQQQRQEQEQEQQQPQEHECYTLKLEEDELVYSQLEAEDSNNELLAKAYGIINSKLDGVTSMFFDYTGEGQNRKVGKFTAKATVTRVRPSGEDLTQCYYIPYEIKDTDECRLEEGHPMRHKCHRSTVCINTVGSYECGCAAGYWGEEESGSPSLDKPIKSEDGACGGENSTESCCGTFGYMKERRTACVEDFKCTNDPCKGNTCDDGTSLCSAGQGYKGYECRCKDGFKKDERGSGLRYTSSSGLLLSRVLGPVWDAAAAPSSWRQQQRHRHTNAAATGENMASDWALDPRMLAFPITKPPPTRWEDVSCVHGRCSRHWGLIRGLIEEQKKARKNRGSSSARLTATLFREVVARLSLSLEAVDTKDKFSCAPGVGEMIQKMGAKHLAAQVTARNPKYQPSNKTFVASAAAILVAMSREVKRRATVVDVTSESNGGKGPPAAAASAAWFTEKEIRRLAAPLCEEDLTHRGDEIVLGEVENFAWCSMAYLTNHNKFDCVARKDLDEKATIAQLQELGERPICSSPGCNAYATKSIGDLSERVKTATFLRSVYCDEHFKEMGGGGGKRKKAAGKGKGKSSKACDPMVLDELDLSPLGGDYKAAGSTHDPPPSPPKGGKIKAGWYRRLLGEALLKVELHRVEKWKGPDVANGLTALWRKDFAKNAKTIYSLTPNGEWMATRLERAIGEGPGSGASSGKANATATASPILNRSSYASCSERDGGGGGGTAASTHNGHSPLAPTRANGAAKPGVRLLIDNREKRGVTSNSQISHLTNYLNSRGVPYEVREWKIGDYGWVVQPDAGKPPAAGEVGYEREFVVPRLLERKRVDDLAESMKDGRLVRQKKAMLRAKSDGVAAEVEVHVEGDTADGRFVDEIYRRGLTPEDLDEALRQAETQGFKVVHHNDFAAFSAYLADATQSLQRQFEARSLDFESFFTWQNLIRFSKGQVPLTPESAAAAAAAGKAAAAAKAARGGRRGRPPMSAAAGGRGRPPLASRAAGDGLRQRTLDGVFGVARRGEDGASGSGEAEGNCAAVGGARGREETAESHAPKAASTREGAIDIDGSPDPGSASDSSDGCSVVEVVVRPIDGGGGSGPGSSAGSGSGSTSGSKRKAAPAVAAGTSSASIAGGGVSSAAAAAAASSVRRTSPIALSPSEPGAAAASSRSVLHGGGGAEDSPLPTTLGRRAGGQSRSVGRNSSRRSKRPRPADEGSRGGDGASSPLQSCARGISGGGGSEWGGVEGTRNKKARSLSFVLDDEDDDRKGGGGRGGDGDLRQANGSGSASGSGGGKGSGSSFGSLPSAASRSVDDSGGGGGGGGGVVDLSLDSPSPPVLPRSRPRTAVSPPRPTSSSGGGVSGGAGTDGIVLEACSSDDEFAL